MCLCAGHVLLCVVFPRVNYSSHPTKFWNMTHESLNLFKGFCRLFPNGRGWGKSQVMAEKPQWMPQAVFNHHDDAIGEIVCRGGKGLVLFYRHIFKAAGHGVFANLKKIGKNISISVNSPEICSLFEVGNPNHVHFTFAREPISRFVAAYAEIEHRIFIGEPWLVYKKMTLILGRHPKGSVERAEAFFSEFLKSGIFGDGHVKPQSEYLGHIKDCDIPMHFIGAVENMSADWSRTGTLKNTFT